jgi:hypothetical protein
MKTILRTKRPEDVLDYDVDFSRWLATDDTITDAEVTVSDGTVVADDFEFTDQVVKVWLSGGEDGDTVFVTVKATTAQEREKEICFRLRIRKRC